MRRAEVERLLEAAKKELRAAKRRGGCNERCQRCASARGVVWLSEALLHTMEGGTLDECWCCGENCPISDWKS